MRFIRLNSFTIIGAILFVIGVVGLIKGPGFEFDAGLPAEPREGFYYLLVGVVMIINGCIVPAAVPESQASEAPTGDKSDGAKRSGQTAAPVRTK